MLATCNLLVSLERTQATHVSFCTIVVALAASPVAAVADGKEVLEAYAETTTDEPVNLLLRVRSGTSPAQRFAAKSKGDLLIISGDLILSTDGNQPIILIRTLCNAQPDQFVNETLIVGRLSSDAKESPSSKSVSRSVAVNRYVNQEEITDWFRVRAYGYSKDRLQQADKGSLVSVSGVLEQRRNRDGAPYPELKVRQIKVHNKSRAGSGSTKDPAAGTSAVGYSHSDFTEDLDMPSTW